MGKKNNRRRISSFVVDARALFRLSIPFFVLLITNVATVFVVSLQTTSAVESIDTANPAAISTALDIEHMVLNTLSFSMLFTGLICFVLWVLYSHRIFGPMVAIRGHVERMEKGDFDGTITLRKTDEFKDLADDLNRLATNLKIKHAK